MANKNQLKHGSQGQASLFKLGLVLLFVRWLKPAFYQIKKEVLLFCNPNPKRSVAAISQEELRFFLRITQFDNVLRKFVQVFFSQCPYQIHYNKNEKSHGD